MASANIPKRNSKGSTGKISWAAALANPAGSLWFDRALGRALAAATRQPLGPQGGGGRPGMQARAEPAAGGIGVDIELNPKTPWKDLSPDLIEKFTDKFFPLDPNGIYPDPEEGRPLTTGQTATVQPRVAPGGPNLSLYQGQSPNSATSQWAQYPRPEMPAALLNAIGTTRAISRGHGKQLPPARPWVR